MTVSLNTPVAYVDGSREHNEVADTKGNSVSAKKVIKTAQPYRAPYKKESALLTKWGIIAKLIKLTQES